MVVPGLMFLIPVLAGNLDLGESWAGGRCLRSAVNGRTVLVHLGAADGDVVVGAVVGTCVVVGANLTSKGIILYHFRCHYTFRLE